MDPNKHETNEKRLIRWLLIATLALLVLVLGLQAWRMLFSPADNRSLTQDSGSGPAQPAVSPGKTAMAEEVQALNPALPLDGLAALSAEELEQLLETGAPGMPVGLSAAATAAEEYAGTLEVDSITWDVDPELDETPAHYEVELHHVTGDYEYKVDAYTGQVLEGRAGILKNVPPADAEAVPAAGNTATPSADAPAGNAANPASAQSGEDAAKTAAFTHAGVQEADAEGLTVKQDWEDGARVYEVEFRVNGVEYDYEIEAATGAVLKAEQKWGGAASGGGALIGESAAKTAALTHAGVRSQDVSSIRWELDWEDGTQIYEIEFVSGGVEYEYEIDAASGAVLKAEQER